MSSVPVESPLYRMIFANLYAVRNQRMAREKEQIASDSVAAAATVKRRRRVQQQIPSQQETLAIEFELVERVDMQKLQAIFARRHELLVQSEATRFATYAEEVRSGGGERRVTYRQAEHKFGRVYPDGSLSLGSFSRPLRSALAANLYYDVDMQNAHPRILRAVAQKHGWPAPALNHYIENRDAVIREMPYTASVSKQIFLAIIMGGARISVLQREAIEDRGWTIFAEQFRDELRHLARLVYDHYTQYRSVVSAKSRNPHVSVLSFVMQEYETRALLAACHFFRLRDWEVGVVIHDGMLVYRRANCEIDDTLLRELCGAVETACEVNIPFGLKQFEEPLL